MYSPDDEYDDLSDEKESEKNTPYSEKCPSCDPHKKNSVSAMGRNNKCQTRACPKCAYALIFIYLGLEENIVEDTRLAHTNVCLVHGIQVEN